MNELTQEYLSEILDYNPVTGVFTRLTSGKGYKVGDRAGSKNNVTGYRRIVINGKGYYEHRLAWLYVFGSMPIKDIDHRNGIKDDNRIDNLREATHAQNMENIGKSSRNTSGFIGVNWDSGRNMWLSRIRSNGRQINLGRFDTPEEAYAAYLKAKSDLHKFNPIPR